MYYVIKHPRNHTTCTVIPELVPLVTGVYLVLFPSYNKREDDFPTLREYNDYLEEVETISKGTS